MVKGSPIPVKFRIETGTVGGIRVGGLAGLLFAGTREAIRVSVFDLKGQAMPCPGLTERPDQFCRAEFDDRQGRARGQSGGLAKVQASPYLG
jgi:hypothetical protein